MKLFNNINRLKIKISKTRERERFSELLISNDELSFCHDIGDMYKVSKIENKKPLSIKEFDSGTATKIVQKKLHKTINELIDDYTSF